MYKFFMGMAVLMAGVSVFGYNTACNIAVVSMAPLFLIWLLYRHLRKVAKSKEMARTRTVTGKVTDVFDNGTSRMAVVDCFDTGKKLVVHTKYPSVEAVCLGKGLTVEVTYREPEDGGHSLLVDMNHLSGVKSREYGMELLGQSSARPTTVEKDPRD